MNHKKFYADVKTAPLPVQIDSSFNLYFQNSQKKLLKISVKSIADQVFSSAQIIARLEFGVPGDRWSGNSIVLTDNDLINKTGEVRKSIAYGIELMLHHRITPIIDRRGLIRNITIGDDSETLASLRQLIAEKNIDTSLRSNNLNHVDSKSFATFGSENLQVIEINNADEALWAEFERLRSKQRVEKSRPGAQPGSRSGNEDDGDIWAYTHADKYDKS